MDISAAKGAHLPQPVKPSAGSNRTAAGANNTSSSARVEPRVEVLPPEMDWQRARTVASAYDDMRAQQIRGYVLDRQPWTPSAREGVTQYKDIAGQGKRAELEALGVDYYV